MFKNLFDLSVQRERKEAIGFYLAYTLFCIVTASVISIILNAAGLVDYSTHDAIYESSKYTAQIVTPFYCVILSGFILHKKELLTVKMFLFVVLAGLLGSLSGLLGMIVPAWLTTKPAPKTRWF